jgi:pyruvate dehydrogenase E1 component beta subunit
MAVISYRQALHDTLRAELARDETVFLIGEEIGVFEGSYKITAGRSPSSARPGCATPHLRGGIRRRAGRGGHVGLRPVVEIMTINFSLLAIRLDRQPRGEDARHVRWPGLRTPGDPHPGWRRPAAGRHPLAEPRGLLRARTRTEGGRAGHPGRRRAPLTAAIRDDDPVIVLENLALYNTKGLVPTASRSARSAGRRPQARQRPHRRRLLASHRHRARRRPPARRRRRVRRSRRPAQPAAPGPGDDLRLGARAPSTSSAPGGTVTIGVT